MKRTRKKLQLASQTVAKLSETRLTQIRGGLGINDDTRCTDQNSGCTSQQGSVQSLACL